MAGNAHKAVFRQRTGGPVGRSEIGKPSVGNIKVDVPGIGQRQEEMMSSR
jgi:hypothetical protein